MIIDNEPGKLIRSQVVYLIVKDNNGEKEFATAM